MLRSEITIACPDLVLYEVGNVLRHKRGVPDSAVMNALTDLLHIGLDIITPTESLLRDTARIAHTRQITFYDAIYVALACQLSAKFVSADKRLCEEARRSVSVESLDG